MEEVAVDYSARTEMKEMAAVHSNCATTEEAAVSVHSSQKSNVHNSPQLQQTPSDSSEAQFICDFCSRTFKRKDRLEIHLKVHTGDRPYICGVPDCNSSYTRLQHLQRHIERVHIPPISFLPKLECPQCSAQLANPECLKRHIERFHAPCAQGKVFECPEDGCDEVFRKKSLLVTHRERDHGTSNPDRCHKCPVEGCDKTFSFPTVLRRHMKIHQGYDCDVDGCGEVFETYLKLRKHKAVEHGPDLYCQQCDTHFKSRQTLVQHLKTHTFVKEVFVCTEPGCERTFLYKKNMMQHVRSFHLGEKVFIRKKVPKDEKDVVKKIPKPKGIKKTAAGFITGIDDRSKTPSPVTALDLSAPCVDQQEQDASCSFEDILRKFYPDQCQEMAQPKQVRQLSDVEDDDALDVHKLIDQSVKSIFEKQRNLSSSVVDADHRGKAGL